MTQLLEQALEAVKKLPDADQDAIATLILERLAEDRAWDEKFANTQDFLGKLAAKAREDLAAGRYRPLGGRRS